MNKIDIFREYLDLMEVQKIRDFTEYAINHLPEYFWTLPASTSGHHHGVGETTLDHVMSMLSIAKNVCNSQMDGFWTERQKSQYISAIILHDGWKCGIEGEELKYDDGRLKTDPNHPEIGYRQVLKLVIDFNRERMLNNKEVIGAKDYSTIARAVKYHYGPYLKFEKPFCWDWSAGSVIVQVHMLDFHQTQNKICDRLRNRGVLKITKYNNGLGLSQLFDFTDVMIMEAKK